MKSEDTNIQIIIAILKPLIGIQLMKQVLCVILLIFDVDEKKIMERLNVSYNLDSESNRKKLKSYEKNQDLSHYYPICKE